MHTEIELLLNGLNQEVSSLNTITLRNAERILNYINDINLDRPGTFEVTAADSLYLLWKIEDWNLHIECLKNGEILFTFRKRGHGIIWGSRMVEEFIPLLEEYLLTVICC